jgi:hypothetical protein
MFVPFADLSLVVGEEIGEAELIQEVRELYGI